MIKKLTLLLLVALMACLQAHAVLNEKNLPQSLGVLRAELKETYEKQQQFMQRMGSMNKAQHAQMLNTMKQSSQISLMLYSQNQGYVFDLTYACHEATELYRQFQERQAPYMKINKYFDTEIERYDRLIASLEMLPPPLAMPKEMAPPPGGGPPGPPPAGKAAPFQLDAQGQADRAACLDYARKLRQGMYTFRNDVRQDSASYARTSMVLKQLDTYAKKRYADIQSSIFSNSGTNYFQMLARFGRYRQLAKQDIDAKYSQSKNFRRVRSEWRGPVVMGYIAFVFSYLVLATLLSILFIFLLNRGLKRLSWIRNSQGAERERRLAKIQKLRPYVGISLGAFIFAVSIMIVKGFLHHNFYLMASQLLVEYAWLLAAITISLLVRLRYNQMRHGYALYTPMMLLGLIIIVFRIIFIPNNLVNLIFPPIALIFTVWQWLVLRHHTGNLKKSEIIDEEQPDAADDEAESSDADDEARDAELSEMDEAKEQEEKKRKLRAFRLRNKQAADINDDTVIANGIAAVFGKVLRRKPKDTSDVSDEPMIPRSDKFYAFFSVIIMFVSTYLTWTGRTLFAVELVIWWLFQLNAIQAITCVFRLLDIYEKSRLYDRLIAKGAQPADLVNNIRKGRYITSTWFFDFVHKALVPIASVYTLIFSLWLAADVFNLTDACMNIFLHPFLNIEGVVQLSIFKLVVVSAGFFLFRYIAYAIKAFYRHFRLRMQTSRTGKVLVRDNEVNLTLGFNVIEIIVWGAYVIFALALLRIPKSGLSLVTAGLATGVGFAMKDLINNFFYGISLMAGRLRVGDWIECEGVEGRVDSITYQSVQVITMDDCLVSFLNSTLFSKNFRNLTRNNSYELVKIPVGVAYGVDVEKVRTMLTDAVMTLQRNDKFGRQVIDTKGNHKVLVLFSNFGDNSVDLTVAMWVLVAERVLFLGQAKEVIYETLQRNNIEIPFPQRDVYIRHLPVVETEKSVEQ